MPFRHLRAPVILLGLTALISTSCLVRRRAIVRNGARPTHALLVADRQSLVETITRQYDAIHDFSAEVNMTPALGSAENNKITEYKDVRAYILLRKPADIRIIGLYPVVRNKAFDMVSTGNEFKLYVPARDRFLVGRNDVVQPSSNKLENLRPQHFLEAILVNPISPTDKLLMENYTDEDNAYYIIHVVREDDGGQQLNLTRTIWFDRTNLRLARELIFDPNGNILTDARYSDWKSFDNVAFPKHIEINRPHDEYAVVIDIVKMDINKGVGAEKFVLNQPEGTTLQIVGRPPQAPASATPSDKGNTSIK